MIITICAFTPVGMQLQSKLSALLQHDCVKEKPAEMTVKQWTSYCFERHLPMVFIGAAGIAVRAVAPYVQDKLTDSPVIVIDEKGQFVIPVLSGHVGGGNDLAQKLAQILGATPVITTATDVEDTFSIDVFAVKNGLTIMNKDGIRLVSKKVLQGEKITMWIAPNIAYPPDIPEEIELVSDGGTDPVDVCIAGNSGSWHLRESLLYLKPNTLCLGMGCKKGKTFEELKTFLESVLRPEQLADLCSLSSIDLKEKEEGLTMLAQYLHLLFETFSADVLAQTTLASGAFSESSFVQDVTGVSNVCERAAIQSAGTGATLVIHKTAWNGMTLAVAEKAPAITTWRTR